jgi:hypothetical protein
VSELDLDLDRVLREIDDEVRARRAAGDFPPGMERDLEVVFAQFAPPTLTGDDLEALVQAADRAAFIQSEPPLASRIPAVSLLKKVELKLLGWFFRFVTQQVTAFAGITVQVLSQLSDRVEKLQQATPAANPALASLSRRFDAVPPLEAALAALGPVDGRVLVPTDEAALGLPNAYATADDLAEHLTLVDDEALAGLVLAGVVDRAPLGVQVALIERAARVLRRGGRVAIVASSPATWGSSNPVEADLAPGRPLHADTWAHLLTERGFQDVAVVAGDERSVITATR